MGEKTLKFNNIILNEKNFHRSKEPTDLLSVDLDQIVVSCGMSTIKFGM